MRIVPAGEVLDAGGSTLQSVLHPVRARQGVVDGRQRQGSELRRLRGGEVCLRAQPRLPRLPVRIPATLCILSPVWALYLLMHAFLSLLSQAGHLLPNRANTCSYRVRCDALRRALLPLTPALRPRSCIRYDNWCDGHTVHTVRPGFYGIGPESPLRQVGERPAPMGHYALHGVLLSCPAGRFGSAQGLSSSECSGSCEAGYAWWVGAAPCTTQLRGANSLICLLVCRCWYTALRERRKLPTSCSAPGLTCTAPGDRVSRHV